MSTLETGSKIGGYRVLGPLGAGAMGEVWRAEDTKLGRQVAIKVLPEDFSDDPDRHARFEREAKILASLNHSNIATLYGLEHLEGKHALVMELVEGEGLNEVIARGPLAIDEVIRIAVQIAEALEAAHEAGIVHRDLKPANIMLTDNGTVKVLDFGLAKSWEAGGSDSSLSLSPTITRNATMEGVILGTAAYMSPEQARGKRVDRRADIWAFGVVLWEMLKGRKLFEGETGPDVMARVLTFAPDWDEVEHEIPRGMARVLRGCLERDARRRFSSAHDVGLLIASGAQDDARPEKSDSPAGFRQRFSALAGVAVLIIGAVLGAVSATKINRGGAGYGVMRTSIVEPEIIVSSGVTVSPDGQRLAFVVSRDEGNVLALRPLGQFEPVILPGTEGAMCPFFSPDGLWLGYFTRTELRKVPIGGGQSRVVAKLNGRVRFDPWSSTSYATADWGDDGTIVFSSGFWREPAVLPGLFTVSAAGGEPQPITNLGGTDLQHGWPSFTPDGQSILFTVSGGGPRNAHIDVFDRSSGTRRRLQKNATDGQVLASGHFVFLDSFYSRLVAAPIDLGSLTLTGPAIPLIEGVGMGASQSYAVSKEGTLVYLAAGLGENEGRIVLAGFDGSVTSLVDRTGAWFQPRISPDGRHLVVREVADECRLWLYDIERRNLTPLTTTGDNHQPVWTRDGQRVIYGSQDTENGVQGLYHQVADGSFPPAMLVSSDAFGDTGSLSVPYPDSLSPGDRELLFERSSISTGSDLWVVPMSGGQPQPFLATPAFEGDGAFSPDGRWVAYVSDESGRDEVYVRAYPGKGGRLQISATGGEWPLWSRDGTRLFFGQGRRLMAVDFSGEGSDAIVGRPQELLRDLDVGRGDFDLMPNGKGVVLVQKFWRGMVEFRIVNGWLSELQDLVPTG